MKAYERFLHYAAYPTMSNEESETIPSTDKQLALARELVTELFVAPVSVQKESAAAFKSRD